MSDISNPKITAVVVTHNRKELLFRCIGALLAQTLPSSLLIVDNASTDGTGEALRFSGLLFRSDVDLLHSEQNCGGAGGFALGMKRAIEDGADWVWMMDDDAEPHVGALEALMKVAVKPEAIYGSLAVNRSEPAWATKLTDPPLGLLAKADDAPERAEVESIPFLGFLIHRTLVDKIGLPDAGFFIAADDTEYCIRARVAGAKIILAGRSRIEHPKSTARTLNFCGLNLIYLALSPWKRYYDTRNRLLIARKYYGLRLLTQTVPGSLVRLVAALVQEPRKLAQLHAFVAGFIDGLLGIKGKRHKAWGIKQ